VKVACVSHQLLSDFYLFIAPIMYKVSNNLTSAYGDEMRPKQGPDMPHVTVGNRRMTNIPMGNGEFVSGIRRNDDLGREEVMQQQDAAAAYEMGPVRPLRYTPGLKCDAHLESLRPSRDPRNPPIQGGDQWKKKLIPAPNTYDGSFADADMQKFRPVPGANPNEDPWYATRLPDPLMSSVDRLAMPFNYGAAPYGSPEVGPYNQMYPQDELSMIKMRNRRYQHAVAMDMMSLNAGGPMMQPYPPQMQQQQQQPMMMQPMMPPAPAPTYGFEHELARNELASIEQDLNMTRRTTRPFVPTSANNYWSLQRQVQQMEDEPLTPPKPVNTDLTSIDQLPLPKPVVRAPHTEAAMTKSSRPEVRIADQIAIRSFVLGHKLPKIGGAKSEGAE